MNNNYLRSVFKSFTLSVIMTLTISSAAMAASPAASAKPSGAAMCPPPGWSENLVNFLKPDAQVPTNNTPLKAVDCDFHEWSWETFIWATALDGKGVPRFMKLPTENDLLSSQLSAGKEGERPLRLATRSPHSQGAGSDLEVAGAIVEADGNMLVAPNGYPVYASVHMNPSYFATAKSNMIRNNGYQNPKPATDYFNVGAAVFKATWLRLATGEKAPAGAYTTQAEVPILTIDPKTNSAVPVQPHKYTKVTVALVGLHVVGYTINHPEFLWATFEHKLNAPMVPDNTFSTSNKPDAKNYTFYKANTPYSQVNLQNSSPATLTFNEKTQTFSPVTNAVQENRTGGENHADGTANIDSLNAAGQGFLSGQKGNQSNFSNYNLIGTEWMQPNTYVGKAALNLNQTNAVGSVNLANTTAETFVQYPSNSNMANVQNCFMCHNAQSYSFPGTTPPPLQSRRIAISHVLGVGTPYAVANLIPLLPKCSDVKTGPIWNNSDAQAKCPTVCGASSSWNGQWKTTAPGSQSVCGCCTKQ